MQKRQYSSPVTWLPPREVPPPGPVFWYCDHKVTLSGTAVTKEDARMAIQFLQIIEQFLPDAGRLKEAETEMVMGSP